MTTPNVGADASFSKQPPAQVAADGCKAIGLYFGPGDPAKITNRAEVDAFHNAGVAVWGVHEDSASSWRGGAAVGQAQGAATRAWARNELGWSDTRPIYLTSDEDVLPQDHDTLVAFQTGGNQGQNVEAGGAHYGDGYALITLSDAGLIVFRWLSDSTGFYESQAYAASGKASIVQHYGWSLPGLHGIDVDDLLTVDFGQDPAPANPIPQPAPPRSDHMIGFFKIPDGPAGVISPDTVWMHLDGMEARSMAIGEAQFWADRAVRAGQPRATVDLTNIGELEWAYAKRMRPFAAVPAPVA